MTNIATWKVVVLAMPEFSQAALYRQVLRTRRRAIPISLNGRTQLVPRAIVRDYLRDYTGAAMHRPPT